MLPRGRSRGGISAQNVGAAVGHAACGGARAIVSLTRAQEAPLDPDPQPVSPIVRVSHIMRWQPLTLSPANSVAAARGIARELGIHHVPVVAGPELVGMLCTCDLGGVADETPVGARMSCDLVTVRAQRPASEAARKMARWSVGCLPVLREGVLVGVVTRGDLARAGVASFRSTGPVCAICGGHHHVRGDRDGNGEGLCPECRRAVGSRGTVRAMTSAA